MDAKLKNIFDERILPMLGDVQAQRKLARKKGLKYAIPAGAVFALLIGVVAYFSEDRSIGLMIILGLFGTLGALIIFGATLQQLTNGIENEFAEKIGKTLTKQAFDGKFEHKPDAAYFPTEHLSSLGGVKLPGTPELDYGLSGTWKDIDFRMVSALFISRSRSKDGDRKSTIYFNGLILKLSVPKVMSSIVVCRKERLLDRFRHRPDKAQMELMPVKNAEFSDIYEIWASDLNAAQKDMTPTFIDAFMDIHNTYSRYEGAMSAAFDGNDFYLTIQQSRDTTKPGYFDLMPGGRSAEKYGDNVSFAYDEISIPCRVIEDLVYHGQT